jgi:hypothetical protein
MQPSIVFFNVAFYIVTFICYFKARQDPSASLGYGFFIVGFWLVMSVILLIGLITRKIRPVSIADKIGVFTATPVICLIVLYILMGSRN